MPWECENERHAYEKCAYTYPLLTHRLTFGFPCVQVPVRRVSPTKYLALSAQLITLFFSYMRRMKELSKRKLAESE